MIFLTPAFLIFGLLTVLIAQYNPRGLAPLGLALAVDFGFMFLFLGWQQTGILIGFSLMGFLALRLGARRGLLPLALALMLALFIVLKKYAFLPALLKPESLPVAVGLSYVLFRLLHLITDRGQGGEVAPGLLAHLHYSLHAQALVSGPFQRYEEHLALMQEAPRPNPLPQLARMGNGFLKVVVVAKVLKSLQAALVPGFALDPHGLVHLLAGGLVWVVFMYYNFSGYMDIVVPWARLCRIDLPENFDRPLLADSFLDFWSRWHMTMTNWFKTYVFSPLMLAFARHTSTRNGAIAASGAAFFFTFLLVGAWHGPYTSFLVCGLLLGLAATINQVTRELLRRRRKAKPAARPLPGLRLLGAGLNFTFIGVAVSPFWLDGTQFLQFLTALASPAGLAVFATVCTAAALATALLRPLMNTALALARRGSPWLDSSFGLAVRIVFLALFLLTASNALPDFVYKGI